MKFIGYVQNLSKEALETLGKDDINDLKSKMPCKVYRTDEQNINDDTFLVKLEGMEYSYEYIHEDFIDLIITNLDA